MPCAELRKTSADLRVMTDREEFNPEVSHENSKGICLAGSVLDNLQGFGLWQKEQLFEEFSGGPELLAASL
jgi:hypothetical protein